MDICHSFGKRRSGRRDAIADSYRPNPPRKRGHIVRTWSAASIARCRRADDRVAGDALRAPHALTSSGFAGLTGKIRRDERRQDEPPICPHPFGYW